MKNHTVFIADDHTLVRDGLRRIIEEDDSYRIIGEAGDGLEVIPTVKKMKPDVLLLDISMPHARGIEAIKKIRRFNKKMKILIVTMHKNEDYVCDCLMTGADGYVLKEDADTELMTALKSIQKGKLFVSPLFTSDVIKNLLTRKRSPEKPPRNTSLKRVTPREYEVLTLVVEGYSNKEMADILAISVRTVEHHRLNIMRKLGTSNTVDLIKYAIRNELVNIV